MKTRFDLENNIKIITKTIRKESPQLIQYLEEIPKDNGQNEAAYIQSLENYYESLKELLAKRAQLKSNDRDEFTYPITEDIYEKGKEKSEINPEDPSKKKTPPSVNAMNEKSFKDDMSGDDLDVPGSELDDQQEKIGSEDEENNYYSLGGDNHNDLEEDKG
ncbi:MAG TPA: hypothetical protein VLZ75_12850 [Chitinophagales bacterium]|nr:hypothetical protein [Chitinophagales bacterium]